MIDINDLYQKDKEFRKYVDAVAQNLDIPVADVLQIDAIKKRAAKIGNEMEQR